jgi:hypothetical protein
MLLSRAWVRARLTSRASTRTRSGWPTARGADPGGGTQWMAPPAKSSCSGWCVPSMAPMRPSMMAPAASPWARAMSSCPSRAGRALRAHAPALQQQQVVGQARHLVQRVGDVEHRDAQLARQPLEPGQQLGLARGVQRGQRLVHQQQARAGGQRAGDGHALALAARQAGGPARQQVADAQQLDGLLQRHAPLGGRHAAPAEVQVALHRQVREQAGLLEHHAQRAAVRGPPDAGRVVLPHLAAHRDVAAGRPCQAGDAAQQRGLAAARGAEDRAHALAGQAHVHIQAEAGGTAQGRAQRHAGAGIRIE